MKSETIIRISSCFNTLRLLLVLLFLFSAESVFPQKSDFPEVDIQTRKKLDYERPPRLEEEDSNNGTVFIFSSGLEIITDIEFVKVYLFDVEAGRTPFESSEVQNGYVRVKLEKPGFNDYSFWVNVKEDHRTTVHVYYESVPNGSTSAVSGISSVPERDSHPLYLSFNPGDPAYYRQIYIMNSEDSEKHYSAMLKSQSSDMILTLAPESSQYPFVFTWDGKNLLDEDQADGQYALQMNPGKRYKVELSRMYSRKALNYYSGTAGLLLVPTAKVLFPGGFQFGSNFSIEKNLESNISADYSLPFSFIMRFSPLKRWEAAAEAEVAFINESGQPSLRLNSSQKVYLYGNSHFQIGVGLRGAYKGAINNLKQTVQNSLVRDPSGFSVFVPMQYVLKNWDFMLSPEFLYSVTTPASVDVSDGFDIAGILKWGVSYSDAIFGVAFSSALYLPSYNGNNMIMQAGLEGSFYIPDTPMYVNLFILNQHEEEGNEGYSTGMNLGFLF